MAGFDPNYRCDKKSLYKYTSYESARLIVANRSLKWSSPEEFNDPYDNCSGLNFLSDTTEFNALIVQAMIEFIWSDAVPRFATELTAYCLKKRGQRDKADKTRFESAMRNVPLPEAIVHEYVDRAAETISSKLRQSAVLCLSETFDNLQMWSHYAKDHSGVVIKLDTTQEFSLLRYARSVEYKEHFLEYASAADLVREMLGGMEIDRGNLAWQLAHLKHAGWQTEKEWRVFHLFKEPLPLGQNHLVTESEETFQSFYLGCAMSSVNRADITKQIRECLPRAKIFLAQKSRRQFALEFVEAQ